MENSSSSPPDAENNGRRKTGKGRGNGPNAGQRALRDEEGLGTRSKQGERNASSDREQADYPVLNEGRGSGRRRNNEGRSAKAELSGGEYAEKTGSRAESAYKGPAGPSEFGSEKVSERKVSPELAPLKSPARPQKRHRIILATFVLLVLLPIIVTGAYLWGVAKDQYASTFAFSVRKEESQSSLDIIGGITRLAGSATSDTDILYEFIRSQDQVASIDADLNLRAIWSRAWPDDPVFAFDPSGSIEDLHAHWLRKVSLSYDSSTGIVTVRALAFDPLEAQAIAKAIFSDSTELINALSEEARADATRIAREERDLSFDRLREARQAMTSFRLRTQIVDIESDLQGQMGLLNTLQAQLAETMIELDLQRETAPAGDPRVRQAERRIEVIEERIAAERAKFGEGGEGPGGEDYARIAAEFERLSVDREFAETTYRSALASYEAAVSSAQRQSRYLAVHIRPTLAERALYPQRLILAALTGFFLLVFWSMGVLVYYSVRDRK